MKIVIGSDEAAFSFKGKVKKLLEDLGYEVTDVGVYNEDPSLYAETAEKVCLEITNGNCQRGIIMCGTGIGMCITANKIPGIRAAVGHDLYSVERSVKSNNCQVLCMGARVIAFQAAELLIKRWLECEFQGGASGPKVDKIMEIEKKYR